MKPLIEAVELKELDTYIYTLIDARGFGNSRERYEQGNIEGALYVDLEDLALHPEDAAAGGRHPLPTVEEFAVLIGGLGITPDTHVVVYDDKAAANPAARFWWMLRSIGHQKVQVLNGGLQAAIDAGLNITTEISALPEATIYPLTQGFTGTASISEVEAAAKDSNRIVIDVRETPRYLGQTEPLDLIAGHIPGAINVPYNTNMGADNRYLSPEQLKANYEKAFGDVKPEQVIVHCGSGVTACHTLLALAQAGLPGAKLYVGSWSEWSRRDLPVATENGIIEPGDKFKM
ncbi:sulfurtransferase [Mucilaginibacter terrae]|uniref:Thiosulfate/3-mercaptopyruvate sulfurtransferase n=1 Tax=Mucilaginibacter terrae TaxID=1955052 RepID=A0ABU3GX41_9SPHI|nr:sulfurtransferase [Mucilaginibacter terrae]MDT3404341.1 thiosulfate/3-mercaptopyruvate sulfurtransferase [Mucilaginibacter terrae]